MFFNDMTHGVADFSPRAFKARNKFRYSKILVIKLPQHLVLLELIDILIALFIEFWIMDAIDPPAAAKVELPVRLLLMMRQLMRDHREDATVFFRLLQLLRVYIYHYQFRLEVSITQRVCFHIPVSRAHHLGLELIAFHLKASARVLEYPLTDLFVGHTK